MTVCRLDRCKAAGGRSGSRVERLVMTKDIVIIGLGIIGMIFFGVIWPMLVARSKEKARPAGETTQRPPLVTASRLPPIGLNRAQFISVVAMSVTVFVVLLGPVWERNYDVDRAVIVSYLLIPPLVVVFLKRERRLKLRSFLISTLAVAITKFAITAAIVVTTWAVFGPPRSDPYSFANELPAKIKEPPPSDTRTHKGRVVDTHGQPVSGAIVFVRSGLDRFGFEVAKTPQIFENDGSGFKPSFSVVQAGQRWEVLSKDGRLHTLIAVDGEGHQAFNQPVVPGSSAERLVPNVSGIFTLECAVHRERHQEQPAHLLVLRHPFYTTSKDDGTFELVVPDVDVRLGAIHPELYQVEISQADVRPSAAVGGPTFGESFGVTGEVDGPPDTRGAHAEWKGHPPSQRDAQQVERGR